MVVYAFAIAISVWWIVAPRGMMRLMERQTGVPTLIGETAWRVSGVTMLLVMALIFMFGYLRF